MSRFDYVRYDERAARHQADFKEAFTSIENMINIYLKPGQAKDSALTKLEESYMWIGKAIRDEQIVRNKGTELQEERGDS